MTSHSLPASEPVSRPAAVWHRGRWIVGVVLVVLLAGGLVGAWWWFHRPVPVDPPLPAHIADPEILHAIQKARQAVIDNPRSAAAWGQLGMTLLAHLYEPEADRCFAEAARLDPGDMRWHYFRSLYAHRRANRDTCISFLRQAAACHTLKEYQSAVNLRLAEEFLEEKQYDEAEPLFRQELYAQPGQQNLRAAYGLGLIAVARGNVQAAKEFLEAARTSPSARSPATAQLAALALARGDDATAATLTREAGPHPGDLAAWPDPLIDLITRLQVGPETRLHDVRDLESQHDHAAAVQFYLRQIEAEPTSQAYIGAGINYARLKDYDHALEYLRKGVRLEPDNAQAHYFLALTQFNRAEKEWQHLPGSEPAKEWLRETVEHARRATELKPDHASAYLFWGLALRYLGESKAAIVQLRKGVLCRPNDFELQFGLGNTLLDTGEDGEAETYLENARKLDPNDPRVHRALERLRQKKGGTSAEPRRP